MTKSKAPQIHEPLATSTLIQAGVPVQHVLWFNRLSPRAKMQALATERGEQVLNKVRQFMNGPNRLNHNAMAV
ncbi:hypothetical protein [Hydrogenophaga sp.]|uniref:hypothetical protein n=1 Tax=Hydrogenophaga sp. TaxID=1904254 RepID=UPI00271CD700|nr:hypothetical protein [Hydrogenophaga sp.]MDO9134015.1 hypothetical protein [Hydrogenophaga sp.]